MRLKADCLFDAGIIDAEERFAVYARTGAALGFCELASMAALDPRRESRPADAAH